MIHDTIKQRLRASLRASASGKSALDTAARLASELSEDGSWNDVDQASNPFPQPACSGHLTRTMLLAKARHLSPFELNGPLQRALDWWLSRDFRGDDLLWNQRTVPRLVGEIALLCEDELSVGARGKVIEILTRSRWAEWSPVAGWVDWQGAALLNVAYNHILRGCLESSPLLCETAFRRIFRSSIWLVPFDARTAHEFEQREEDQAPSDDLTQTHDYAQMVALAHGTPWQAPGESVKAFVSHLLDFQQWTIRLGGLNGHDRTGWEAGVAPDLRGLASALAQLSHLGNPPRRMELTALSERLIGEGKPLSGHRYFWRSRLVVHQRPAFACLLRLDDGSNNHSGEVGNEVAFAEGFVQFTRHGREYAGMGRQQTSRLPAGVHQPTNGGSAARSQPFFPKRPRYVGAVGDGEYGLAALEFRNQRLQGQKAWFFFDDSVVCLQAGLQKATPEPAAFSAVNQCSLHGPVTVETVTRHRHTVVAGRSHELTDVRRVEHDGLLYHFLDAPRLVAQVSPGADEGAHAPNGASAIFTLRINHGALLNVSSTAHVVLPLDDNPAARNRAEVEIAQLEIFANTASVQAVRHSGTGMLGLVFWESAVLPLPHGGRIAANQPCLLLCREDSWGSPTLSIANPLGAPSTVHVEFGGRCLCFELPGGRESGRSIRREL